MTLVPPPSNALAAREALAFGRKSAAAPKALAGDRSSAVDSLPGLIMVMMRLSSWISN
jgi:hypothetical protein